MQVNPKTQEEQEEIERKFFRPNLPTLPKHIGEYPFKVLVAGYFRDENGEKIRIRMEGDKYFKVNKKGKGVVRNIGPNGDIEISQEEFLLLWPRTEGQRIHKIRFYIPYEKWTVELDTYPGFKNFYTIEVEFKTVEEARAFIPPAWFGWEVTDDDRYSSSNLAKDGPPIPEFDLASGVPELYRMVVEKIESTDSNIIVQIAGGSASGKTSQVALRLRKMIGDDSRILSMDDYYRGKAHMDSEKENGNVLNWDQPKALDLGMLDEHLKMLQIGSPIDKPRYDFKTGERVGRENFDPARVIIVEGLFALNNAVLQDGAVKVFVDIGFHGRVLRRLLRDIERTGEKPSDILDYFSSVVEPMHEKHVQSTMVNADVVIKNEYQPEVEAERSGLHEVQLKFRANLSREELRKKGAERLGMVTQVDHYYNPKDRNLADTKEALRIREEGDARILTYKGPKVKSQFRKRPKFEFEIDTAMTARFLALYGSRTKTIKKKRELYCLKGTIFSLDEVFVQSWDDDIPLGYFVEIRSTSKSVDEDEIEELVALLGLDMKDAIRESYFEIAAAA